MNREHPFSVDSTNVSLSAAASASAQFVMAACPLPMTAGFSDGDGSESRDESALETVAATIAECARILSPGCRMAVLVRDDGKATAVEKDGIRSRLGWWIEKTARDLDLDPVGEIAVMRPSDTRRRWSRGTFPWPRRGEIGAMHDRCLIFEKSGAAPEPSAETKRRSRLSNSDWDLFFADRWAFDAGMSSIAIQGEIVGRLTRMFTFVEETVLLVGLSEECISIPTQHERSSRFADDAFSRSLVKESVPMPTPTPTPTTIVAVDQVPTEKTCRVRAVESDLLLRLDDGRAVGFLGLEFIDSERERARRLLSEMLVGRRVYLDDFTARGTECVAFVRTKQKLHINALLLREGMAHARRDEKHRMFHRFQRYAAVGDAKRRSHGTSIAPAAGDMELALAGPQPVGDDVEFSG